MVFLSHIFSRFQFATHYALRHLGISVAVALFSAAFVFGLLYPAPYRNLLGVESIFLLVLAVDVVCGPLLTLVLASPKKSHRERWLDFSLVGLIQLVALTYGLHSVWAGRPVALVFEVDRLVAITANEIEPAELDGAPEGFRRLPWWGVLKAGTRQARNSTEYMQALDRGLAGISLAQQPGWWTPWAQARENMETRAKPLSDLLASRPQDAATLQAAAQRTGLPNDALRYLPLTSSKTLDWVALLDGELNLVGWAPVDGF
ncbi:MAG TPA: hypothetical protein PKD71_11280 [Ottowia sp.]|jgi:hypothetical protein|nr:hypothetical protein [Ottowia sp.]